MDIEGAYTKCNKLVKWLVARSGVPNSHQEDAEQDAWLLISGKIGQYDPEKGKLSSWLSRVAINSFLQYMGKDSLRRKWVGSLSSDADGESFGDESFLSSARARIKMPENPVDDADERALFLKLFDKLEPKYKTVLMLRYGLDGRPPMELREVAAVMGISHQCVANYVKDAIDMIREQVQN